MLLVERAILRTLRRPAALLGGLGMSLFFLAVYSAGIGGVGFLPQFGDGGYLAFLFPMSLVSLAMGSAAGAGQSLYDDMVSGYFRRLYLSPLHRWTFVAAPIAADAVATGLGSLGILAAGLLFGVPVRFGAMSVLGLLLLSLLWGVTLSALSAGVMIRTGRPEGARIVTSTVFPLVFLSTTFMPRELITAHWLRAVSWANPVTYLLEGMRYLLAGTAPAEYLLIGLAFSFASAGAALAYALTGTRRVLV